MTLRSCPFFELSGKGSLDKSKTVVLHTLPGFDLTETKKWENMRSGRSVCCHRGYSHCVCVYVCVCVVTVGVITHSVGVVTLGVATVVVVDDVYLQRIRLNHVAHNFETLSKPPKSFQGLK